MAGDEIMDFLEYYYLANFTAEYPVYYKLFISQLNKELHDG